MHIHLFFTWHSMETIVKKTSKGIKRWGVFLCFPNNLWNVYVLEECHSKFDRDCTDSVYSFGQVSNFNNIFSHEHRISFHSCLLALILIICWGIEQIQCCYELKGVLLFSQPLTELSLLHSKSHIKTGRWLQITFLQEALLTEKTLQWNKSPLCFILNYGRVLHNNLYCRQCHW